MKNSTYQQNSSFEFFILNLFTFYKEVGIIENLLYKEFIFQKNLNT